MTNGDGNGGYTPSTYGDAFADVYDDWYGDASGLDTVVETLVGLAGNAPILELGVGTGRIALPLAAYGAAVTGIDSSTAMLDRLRLNDPSANVTAVEANMASFDLIERFGLAFVAFNTLFNLSEEDEQQRCFVCVGRSLVEGGRFVVEAIVPDLDPQADDRGITPTAVDSGRVVLAITMTDKSTQVVRGQHMEIGTDGGIKLRPWRIRYSSVEQLDAMAAFAGFSLESRWEDWSKRPFSEDSTRHVTVYRLGSHQT